MNKPFAESSEQNKQPILDVLAELFDAPGTVLEIGAGTGQHAVFFPRHLGHLTWQPTDVAEALPGMSLWIEEAALANVSAPLHLDVLDPAWPAGPVDYVFSANTVHIMHWPAVEAMFAGIGRVLAPGGRFALYGPFNRNGAYTSDSNARFDQWLKGRDPGSGIRDLERLDDLARAAGMSLEADIAMPANNAVLCWRKHETA
jgi:SAM-dependent methyltransferase